MSSPSSDKTLPGIGPDYLKPGALVFHNRYRLIKEIGRGGMGVVWLAEDVHLKDRKLALKFPIGITSWEPAELDHLRAQVLVGQELRHDRLLATFDLAHEPPLAAIVMAYADGHTLKQKLDLHPMHYFEPDEIRPWLLDVLEALTYLHQSKRIVHRDVKPANVIVDDQEDHAVLMDFGISQVIRNTIRHTVSTDQVTSEQRRSVVNQKIFCKCGVTRVVEAEENSKKGKVLVGNKRRMRCRECAGCKATKCNECQFCLKPHLKKPCVRKVCLFPVVPKCPCFA